MQQSNNIGQYEPTTKSVRHGNGRVAPGHKVVYAVVPEEVFHLAKAQSHLSGQSWHDFISSVLSKVSSGNEKQTTNGIENQSHLY